MERGPDVGLEGVAGARAAALAAEDDFGGHEAGGALERGGFGDPAEEPAAAPKVGQFTRSRVVHQHVLALHVAVDDALRVKVLEAVEHLSCKLS